MSRTSIWCTFVIALLWSFFAAAADLLVDDVPLPRDAHIAPLRGVPENFKAFSGAWVGTWGARPHHVLIVESIAADGTARVIYAVGDNPARNVRPQWYRHSARISENMLRIDEVATYQLTPSGKLDANYIGNGRGAAVLSKIKLSDLLRPGATIAWIKPVETDEKPLREESTPPGPVKPPVSVTTNPATKADVAQISSVTPPPGRRIALVVGVSKYEHAPPLTNTLNDALGMTQALQRLGFEVENVIDPGRAELESAIRRFGNKSIGAQVSVFHFSGHALESGRRNWLLPATANISSERDLRFEAVDLDTILDQTDGASNISVVFLDACRDNPFQRRLVPTRAVAAGEHGLANVPMTSTGMLVAFAAAPGQVALDGDARHSPFTAALLNHIETPSLEIKSMMARVTKAVVEATKGKQRPWQNSSLEGEFYFVPPQASSPALAAVAHGSTNVEVVFWDSIKASRDPADMQAYLRQFPKGAFAELARNRLARLQRQATAVPAQVVPPTPDKPPASSASPFHDLLLARFAAVSVATTEAESRIRNYEAEPDHKAIAVALKARLTWRQGGWSTGAAAATATLEKCQVYYREPCALMAVDDKIEPVKGDAPLLHDMSRTRYAGRFDPERIPGAGGGLMTRSDVTSYRSAAGPKAAAYHPWGRLFVATGAAGQFEAEEQVLAQCNSDPDRKGRDGPCFLYAAGDRVMLAQRLEKARPQPKTISETFAYLAVPRYSYNYGEHKSHKAIAFAPENGQTFSWQAQSSVTVAEDRALEGCQLTHRTPCVILASDETLQAPDPWKAARRDMPRLHLDGTYKPENVPLFSGSGGELRSYAALPAPKAMVIRPKGARVRTATGSTPEEAQAKALAACNDDLDALPCFVYAVNDRVVLGQRRTEPLQ